MVEPYGEHGVKIGPHNPPDVVFEVDHTTDVRRLGERDGGSPDDDPLLRSLRRESHAQGQMEGLATAVLQIFRSRGMEVSEGFPGNAPEFAKTPQAALIQAALTCADEGDFRKLIQDR